MQGLNRWQETAPSLITALRILLLPLIWSLWVQDHVVFSLLLYTLAILSDVADGRVARRLKASSAFGAFFDVISDVVLLLGLLLLLGLYGVVPIWLFFAPLAAAMAFFMTSNRAVARYDPVGKYYGSILFAIVGCLLCKPGRVLSVILCVLIGILSMIVIANRWRIGAARPEAVRVGATMER